jgi:dipeptidyl aminopeptidase/acylaminoacyl peptidase
MAPLRSLLLFGVLVCSAFAEPPPRIPLKDFFDNPKISGAQISPDGKRLAVLMPAGGRMNVWIMDVGQTPEQARQITSDTKRGITRFFWSFDGRWLLYSQDRGGDENFHLYRADPIQETPNAVDLTPFDGARADVLDLPRDRPGEALITLNQRNHDVFDVHRIDLASGKLTLIEQNPGDVDSWVVDTRGAVRAAVAKVGTDTELRVREEAAGPFHKLARFGDEDDANAHAFSKEGNFLYVTHAHGANATRLFKLDAVTAKESVIAEDPNYDVGDVIISDVTHELVAVAFQRERLEYQSFNAQFTKDLAALRKVHDGDVLFRSADVTESKWIVAFNSPTDPGATYLYDRESGTAQFLYRPRPWLKSELLAEMQPISYSSRDGLTIHGYLTTPRDLAPRGLPLVLVVHGGPWARDDWGYDGEVQWLANRGYAVLQVNYRGSTGYGKAFLEAGNREWGGKMLDDLIDGVEWAVKEGIADRERLAIYGGSYGGYATLSALAFRPGVFRCGVDYVGVSNLLTFMKTIPPYWETFRPVMYRRVGDPEKDADFLRSRSPLFSADKIDVPLLIAQGFNDPRVNVKEAEQIKAALEARGHPVEYVLKMDEGHGFANPENRLDLYQKMETFFARFLADAPTKKQTGK